MDDLPTALRRLEIHDVDRISFPVTAYMNRTKIPVTATGLFFSETFIIRIPINHLRMVDRRLFIEDTDILMLSKRLSSGIEEICRLGLFPYPFISEHFPVAKYQFRCKQSLGGQNYRPGILHYSPVFLPQFPKRNNTVPFIPGHSIRKIAHHHVYAIVGKPSHIFQTVPFVHGVDNTIQCKKYLVFISHLIPYLK